MSLCVNFLTFRWIAETSYGSGRMYFNFLTLTIKALRTFETSEFAHPKTNRYVPEDFNVQKHVPQMSHYLLFHSLPKKIPTSQKCSVTKSLLFAGGIKLKTNKFSAQHTAALRVICSARYSNTYSIN